MPNFSFTARDENGIPSNGTVIAASIAEAGQMLRADGKYPISIRAADESAAPAATRGGASGAVGRSGVKVSRADVIQFSTQLSIMVETGVTLSEALECISQQASKPNVKQLTDDLRTHVQQGGDLSAALARHPRSFPRLYVALIKAAEKSGMLNKLLNRALAYLRDENDTIRRVRGALTYPAIMFAFALTTTIGLLTFVLPRFTAIYASKGAALPMPTRILMAISDGLISHWVLVLGSAVALVVGGHFYLRTEAGRLTAHAIQLRLPLLGSVFSTLHLARGMRMIGTMAGAGISLVECVSVAQDLCGNAHYQKMWMRVSASIQSGKPMAEAMAASPLVPRSVAQMVHSGEKSGKLAMVMEQVANFSELELKERVADLTRYIEPAMIIVMGALIGGVALALMLPIFTISRVVAH